jgi:hypothetical protein
MQNTDATLSDIHGVDPELQVVLATQRLGMELGTENLSVRAPRVKVQLPVRQ